MIDGQAAANPGPILVSERPKGTPPDLGFTFAAVDLIRVADSRVENVRVKGWPSDGISVQGQVAAHGKYHGNAVTKCFVENCRGPGYHAGGRLEDSEFTENEARGNLGDGFYFCAWVTRIAVRNNKFIRNQGSGVGGLGDAGDRDNVVEGNTCEANGKSGVQLWDGRKHREGQHVPQQLAVLRPARSAASRWPPPPAASSLAIAASTISRERHKNTASKKPPIAAPNSVMNNETNGNLSGGLALLGKEGQYSGNRQ